MESIMKYCLSATKAQAHEEELGNNKEGDNRKRKFFNPLK